MILLKENILEQKEKLHDVKVECFTEIQKMEKKVQDLEKHLEIVSQINLKMESLQSKIEELEKWKNMDKMFQVAFPQSNIMTSGYTLWVLVNVKN